MRSNSVLIATVLALPLHPAAAKTGGCTLQLDGRTYPDSPCNIDLEPGGGFSIGTGNPATTGNWNGTEPSSTHAHTPLGTLRRQGACWVNDCARVCARVAL